MNDSGPDTTCVQFLASGYFKGAIVHGVLNPSGGDMTGLRTLCKRRVLGDAGSWRTIDAYITCGHCWNAVWHAERKAAKE